MALFSNGYYPVGASGVSFLCVADVDCKGGVGPRTTHLTYQKVYRLIDGDDFVLSRSREYSSMSC